MSRVSSTKRQLPSMLAESVIDGFLRSTALVHGGKNGGSPIIRPSAGARRCSSRSPETASQRTTAPAHRQHLLECLRHGSVAEKYRYTKRKWCKLYLAVDADSGQIAAITLTDQDVSDESQVGQLHEQIESEIEQITADCAYDGEPTYQTVAAHDANIAIVIPSRLDAVPSDDFESHPTPRDTQLLMIDSLGRFGWQEATGYGQRALVGTATGVLHFDRRVSATLSRRCPGRRPGPQSHVGCCEAAVPSAARRAQPKVSGQRSEPIHLPCLLAPTLVGCQAAY